MSSLNKSYQAIISNKAANFFNVTAGDYILKNGETKLVLLCDNTDRVFDLLSKNDSTIDNGLLELYLYQAHTSPEFIRRATAVGVNLSKLVA